MHIKNFFQELKPYTIYVLMTSIGTSNFKFVSMLRHDTFILKKRQVFNG